jgi:hypothetical protein
LEATVTGADNPAVAGELSKGSFSLFCDGQTGGLAKAPLAEGKLKFSLAAGASLPAGALCYVNMELAAADQPQGKATFYQGEGIYYATNKAPVVNAGDHNEIKLEIFKSYSIAGTDAGDETLPEVKAFVALTAAGASAPAPLAGKLSLDGCAKDAKASLVAPAVLVDGKAYVTVSFPAVKKTLLGDSCQAKFLADGSRKAFKTAQPVVIAAAIGSEAAPLALSEILEGEVAVSVALAGSCRRFDDNRQCIFVFPEECTLPLGEVQGAYETSKWLHCVSLAAGSTIKSAQRSNVQIQQQADQSKLLRLLQSLQQIEDNFAQAKSAADQSELVKKRLALARSIDVKDPGVAYGAEIMVKVLSTVQVNVCK